MTQPTAEFAEADIFYRNMTGRSPATGAVVRILALACVATLYIVAGVLGLRLGIVHESASPVWAPTGIALAAMLRLGRGVWPAIVVGALGANLLNGSSLPVALGIALGNTLEAVIGAAFVNRWAGGVNAFDRAGGIIRFAFLAGLAATTVSATIGTGSLVLGGAAQIALADDIWLTWWLGDAAGALLVTPPLLLWSNRPRLSLRLRRVAEALVMGVLVAVTAAIAFGASGAEGGPRVNLWYVCIPALVAVAVRFGPRDTSTAVAVASAIGVALVTRSLGDLQPADRNATLVSLQAFMALTAVTKLMLSASVTALRASEERLAMLALTDPLTGLGNYRHMVQVLEAELQRSSRTGRPFALLFFDVNGLKAINDRHGHLVGSRALCRVSDALRDCCRAVDTPARYGGDEFALILPETREDEARAVAVRVGHRLARDTEKPLVVASAGLAICPRDGVTVDELLSRADRRLYEEKVLR